MNCPKDFGLVEIFPIAALPSGRGLRQGGSRWVDGVGIDSCHLVWMQLHEDLLATLGLNCGHEA
jgi:hypothetical protein